jgi:hypothetical protein
VSREGRLFQNFAPKTIWSAAACSEPCTDVDFHKHRKIGLARWNDPSATFGASFPNWADAKGAYNLIENESPEISMRTLS